MASHKTVLQFPVLAGPAVAGATRCQVWRWRARLLIGRGLAWLKAPGLVSNVTIHDPVTGQRIEVRVGPLFTTVSVNGRDYYFTRFSGTYDGGLGCG